MHIMIIFIKKGRIFMTQLVHTVKKAMTDNTSLFSLLPNTDYNKHVPESAEELMKQNWQRTGKTLSNAIHKVGEELEQRK